MNIRSLCKWLVLVLVAASSTTPLYASEKPEVQRWREESARVTIIRDDRGIAHVYGQTDADAVFGMEYAQAEDESKVYQDLSTKLFVDLVVLKQEYAESPAWLKVLMDAFADGLNFYLYKHPAVKPRGIHFEPWMALSFTEGSIGADIEPINLNQLEAFYGNASMTENQNNHSPTVQAAYAFDSDPPEPTGSNGMAIAPANTADHHALLLINPHTSFFFRSELQMLSNHGLDAYGAITWGQFFVYQGFNQRVGWMHTSSGVDTVDRYVETVEKKGNHFFYKYGSAERAVIAMLITVPYKTDRLSESCAPLELVSDFRVFHPLDEVFVAVRTMPKGGL